jgi:hypothetical protein
MLCPVKDAATYDVLTPVPILDSKEVVNHECPYNTESRFLSVDKVNAVKCCYVEVSAL